MIRARVRVDDGDDSFTILVCAESLQKAERTVKTRYPESTVRIPFPLEPEYFFVDGPSPCRRLHRSRHNGGASRHHETDVVRPGTALCL